MLDMLLWENTMLQRIVEHVPCANVPSVICQVQLARCAQMWRPNFRTTLQKLSARHVQKVAAGLAPRSYYFTLYLLSRLAERLNATVEACRRCWLAEPSSKASLSWPNRGNLFLHNQRHMTCSPFFDMAFKGLTSADR